MAYIVNLNHSLGFCKRWVATNANNRGLEESHNYLARGRPTGGIGYYLIIWLGIYRENAFRAQRANEIAQLINHFTGTNLRSRISRLKAKFVGKHEKIVAARNHLRRLYLQVGVHALLATESWLKRTSLVQWSYSTRIGVLQVCKWIRNYQEVQIVRRNSRPHPQEHISRHWRTKWKWRRKCIWRLSHRYSSVKQRGASEGLGNLGWSICGNMGWRLHGWVSARVGWLRVTATCARCILEDATVNEETTLVTTSSWRF